MNQPSTELTSTDTKFHAGDARIAGVEGRKTPVGDERFAGEENTKKAAGPGSNYGNGGLSGGLGVSPTALAFILLAELQAKYQEILVMKTKLTAAAGTASQNLVTEQNEHYSNEVTNQAWQMYG